MGLRVSAPGKLMLSGEYAVLDGAPAVVASVDARAVVTLPAHPSDRGRGAPPEVNATWRLARARYPGLPEAAPCVDVRALRDPSGAQKLGLGSSAAAAAAAAGLAQVLAHGEQALRDDAARAALFELAFAGHAAIAPEGSGADVAASACGGFIRFRPAAEGAHRLPTFEALSAPPGLVMRVVWTGQAARTSDLVGQVKRFQAHDARAYAPLAAELQAAAAAFADAFEAGALDAVLALATRYHEAMRALGEAARAPIVEDRLRTVARLAQQAGGSAKPSGAGGGDVAIAFFVGPDTAAAFERLTTQAGFETLGLTLGAEGPRVD